VPESSGPAQKPLPLAKWLAVFAQGFHLGNVAPVGFSSLLWQFAAPPIGSLSSLLSCFF